MSLNTQTSRPSWPFPVIGHFRIAAGSGEREDHEAAPDDGEPDLVEQELVEEQLERDRKASKAVDSKLKSGDRH